MSKLGQIVKFLDLRQLVILDPKGGKVMQFLNPFQAIDVHVPKVNLGDLA
ncbi:MAG: hypothetical protein HOI65_15795 [Opitutae bacterium]|nr:hypothetical protein [Opitutae bacterium]